MGFEKLLDHRRLQVLLEPHPLRLVLQQTQPLRLVRLLVLPELRHRLVLPRMPPLRWVLPARPLLPPEPQLRLALPRMRPLCPARLRVQSPAIPERRPLRLALRRTQPLRPAQSVVLPQPRLVVGRVRLVRLAFRPQRRASHPVRLAFRRGLPACLAYPAASHPPLREHSLVPDCWPRVPLPVPRRNNRRIPQRTLTTSTTNPTTDERCEA